MYKKVFCNNLHQAVKHVSVQFRSQCLSLPRSNESRKAFLRKESGNDVGPKKRIQG